MGLGPQREGSCLYLVLSLAKLPIQGKEARLLSRYERPGGAGVLGCFDSGDSVVKTHFLITSDIPLAFYKKRPTSFFCFPYFPDQQRHCQFQQAQCLLQALLFCPGPTGNSAFKLRETTYTHVPPSLLLVLLALLVTLKLLDRSIQVLLRWLRCWR